MIDQVQVVCWVSVTSQIGLTAVHLAHEPYHTYRGYILVLKVTAVVSFNFKNTFLNVDTIQFSSFLKIDRYINGILLFRIIKS